MYKWRCDVRVKRILYIKKYVAMWLLNYATASIGLSVASVYNYLYTYGYILVEIDKGILRGSNASTWKGGNYQSFKGVPYAEPPIGELRFKGPKEETAWDGIKEASTHGEVCPHVDIAFDVLRGEEDCLYLNVYTPGIGDKRLPVMFWINGGKFMLGSGNDELFGPDYFMDAKNVVLVTINYRLGALGFLSTGDDGAPGNAGMKDQVAALKWVRRNIAKFGGDPDNVTIFGGSSGAACVEYHLLSPMSRGLFAKGIAHSGSALNTWALSENAPEVTIRLAEALGAKDVAGDTSGALKFLRAAPAEDIVRMQEGLVTPAHRRIRIETLFTPTVETGVKSEEVFLPDTPLRILESGNFTKVPYLTGYSSQEGYFFNDELEKPETLIAAMEDTDRFVPTDIKHPQLRKDLAKSIRKFYFDDKPIGNENISNLVNLYSDATFVAGIRRATELKRRSTNGPIYFYVFSYNGGMNFLKFAWNIDCPGAVHGDELGYLFHQKLLFWRKPASGSEDEYVINGMIRMWTNFAKYGNPTPAGDRLAWKPVSSGKFNYLKISGRDTELAENPDEERADFWTGAYERNAAFTQ